MRHLRLPVAIALLIGGACMHQTSTTTTIAPSPPPLPNQLSAIEAAAGWQLLFDGHSLKGWHGLGYTETPPGLWNVQDGAIQHAAKGKSPVQADGQPIAGFDLISDSVYRDFELSWEWKISVAGNSGLKYNVDEKLSTSMAPTHAAKGWEYQMNDDSLNDDNKLATHRSGALYDMIPPNDKKKLNPAGQWNSSMLVFRGTHGEHWLNGEKIVDFDYGTPQFDAAFAMSKYEKYPAWFPTRRAGGIVLQDHNDVVAFRNIKIRVLK